VAPCPKNTNARVYRGQYQEAKKNEEHDEGKDGTADRSWCGTVSDNKIFVVTEKKADLLHHTEARRDQPSKTAL
jgi:hypothetical protein